MRDNKGINTLGRILAGQMKELLQNPPVLDFGVVQGDYSLKTNTYPIPIPASDYLICRSLSGGKAGSLFSKTTNGGKHSHDEPLSESQQGAHQHEILLPSFLCSVKPGDRVLVAWVGNDAVVVDLILPATAAKG